MQMGGSLLASIREKNRLLAEHLCARGRTHQQFFYVTTWATSIRPRCGCPLPTLTLERHGLSRVLSLPPDRDWVSFQHR